MVNGVGLKTILGRAFCCSRPTIIEDPITPAPIDKCDSTTTHQMSHSAKDEPRMRRMSAISYKSCISNTNTFRSLSCSSLQSALSRNTGDYDYCSIYSQSSSSGRASYNSCST